MTEDFLLILIKSSNKVHKDKLVKEYQQLEWAIFDLEKSLTSQDEEVLAEKELLQKQLDSMKECQNILAKRIDKLQTSTGFLYVYGDFTIDGATYSVYKLLEDCRVITNYHNPKGKLEPKGSYCVVDESDNVQILSPKEGKKMFNI